MLPVWAGEMLAKINLSVSCFEILGESRAHRKVDARGAVFHEAPRLPIPNGNDVTEVQHCRQAGYMTYNSPLA